MAVSNIDKATMKAVQWENVPFSVSVNNVPVPKISDPLDVIVRLTSAAICGTDLHSYHGRIPTDKNLTFGHESLGIIEEIGTDITTFRVGDRVLVDWSVEESMDNGDIEVVGAFGLGNYLSSQGFVLPGGQAQYLRVPFGNVNLLKLPCGTEHELDYLLLSDIWPTAWFALELAGQVFGDTVVVFGAGMLNCSSRYLRYWC